MTEGTILPMFMSTTVSNGILNAMTGLKSPQITDLVSVFQTLGDQPDRIYLKNDKQYLSIYKSIILYIHQHLYILVSLLS
jgi:hypothetical protein